MKKTALFFVATVCALFSLSCEAQQDIRELLKDDPFKHPENQLKPIPPSPIPFQTATTVVVPPPAVPNQAVVAKTSSVVIPKTQTAVTKEPVAVRHPKKTPLQYVAVLTDSLGVMAAQLGEFAQDFMFSPAATICRPLLEGDSCRKWQKKMYAFALPKYLAVWSKKDDSLQAVDLFKLWKVKQYLAVYDARSERSRAKKDNFLITDTHGREDEDAGLYAFWHRRIEYFAFNKKGFSLATSRYYTTDLYAKMKQLAGADAIRISMRIRKEYLASINPEKVEKKKGKK